MNVTVNHPKGMTVQPEHVSRDGRVMVYIEEGGDPFAVLLWIRPEQATQWIETLRPISAKAGQQ